MIDVLNVLPEEEIELIDEYRSRYGGYCDYGFAPIQTYLDPWSEAKEDLFHRFGDKLRIKKRVCIKKSVEELESDFLANMPSEVHSFLSKIDEFLYDVIETEHNYESWGYSLKGNITDNRSIVENRLKSLYSDRPKNCHEYLIFNNGEKFELTYGMKTTKVIKKIAEVYKIEGYEQFRLYQSQILNQKEVSGDLFLSIHPMDYMTMSDNDCDWTSCMSWMNEGEFRQGTVEMMNSPMVIIAYLTSEKPFKPFSNKISWTNKKWRTLIVLNKDILCSIKSYPYFNDDLTQIALKFAKETLTLEEEFNSQLYLLKHGFVKTESGLEEFREKYEKETSMSLPCAAFSATTHNMYNDFGTAWHFGFIGKDISNLCNSIRFNYSGVSECVKCGAVNNDICEDRLTCWEDEEDDYFYCNDCDYRYPYEEGYYISDNNGYVCEECLHEGYFKDQIIGTYHYNSNKSYLVLYDNDKPISFALVNISNFTENHEEDDFLKLDAKNLFEIEDVNSIISDPIDCDAYGVSIEKVDSIVLSLFYSYGCTFKGVSKSNFYKKVEEKKAQENIVHLSF